MGKPQVLFLIILISAIFVPLTIADESSMEQTGKETNQTLINETIEKVDETATPIWLSSVLAISLLIGLLLISYKYLRA